MRALTRQIVVRVDEDLYARLVADAEQHGRTVAQSVRFHLRSVGQRRSDTDLEAQVRAHRRTHGGQQ